MTQNGYKEKGFLGPDGATSMVSCVAVMMMHSNTTNADVADIRNRPYVSYPLSGLCLERSALVSFPCVA
jgi:hypothetical protein